MRRLPLLVWQRRRTLLYAATWLVPILLPAVIPGIGTGVAVLLTVTATSILDRFVLLGTPEPPALTSRKDIAGSIIAEATLIGTRSGLAAGTSEVIQQLDKSEWSQLVIVLGIAIIALAGLSIIFQSLFTLGLVTDLERLRLLEVNRGYDAERRRQQKADRKQQVRHQFLLVRIRERLFFTSSLSFCLLVFTVSIFPTAQWLQYTELVFFLGPGAIALALMGVKPQRQLDSPVPDA